MSAHLKWLVDTGRTVQSVDGIPIKLMEFRHEKDDTILKAWARHFRNHYCLDSELDRLKPNHISRADYLKNEKFPDDTKKPGPSIRSGDFAEILVADYVEYFLSFWVPRTRFISKAIRNESTKGCDIIGFKFARMGKISSLDAMIIFEVKAQLSTSKAKPRLQDAVNDSKKDHLRKAESLNAIKQQFVYRSQNEEAQKLERFQNPADHPFKENYGAVALFNSSIFDEALIATTDGSNHPNKKALLLIAMHGKDMMDLANELYKRAADEA